MRTVLGFCFILAAWHLCAADRAAAEVRDILVLDTTAQMSAKFGQQRKIDAMKNAVNAAVSRMAPETQVSVWAFGINPSKKCEDRGELVRLQKAAAASAAKALADLQPKAGRAPVFGTVQSALDAAGDPKEGAMTVAVIAGTGDDCTGDICGEARKLHSVYPNAKLNVFGLAMNEQSAANFDCAAKAMGGAFTAVKSSSDLDRALRQSLDIGANAKVVKAEEPAAASGNTKASSSENGPAASTAPAAETGAAVPAEAKPALSTQPQPEPNTVLTAVLGDGAPPLDSGVTWEVYKINVTPTQQLRPAETPMWTGGGGQAKLKLPEGRYQIHAQYGFASAEDRIIVNSAKVEKTVSLNAGTISAEALQALGSEAVGNSFFVLYRRKTAAALEELGRSSEMPAIFHVNVGDYVLSASSGLAKIDTAVKVEAAKVSAVRVPLNVGILGIETFAAEAASQRVPAWHRIFPVQAEPGKSAAPLLIIAGGSHRIQLPAGSYRLETEYGNARVESAISVVAGQTVSQKIVVSAGEATITVPPGKPAQICSIYEAGSGDGANAVGRAAGTSMTFILKAGVYDVKCGVKGGTAPAGQTQIRVAAGETLQTKLAD